MSRIAGYGVYQNGYMGSAAKSRNTREADKADKADKTEKKEQVQLSDRAKKLLEELKKNYNNMDFIVADYETDEEASVSRPRQHGHLKRKDSIRFLVFLDFSLIFIRSG